MSESLSLSPNVSHVDGSVGAHPQRRAARACHVCHKRKVRCDASLKAPGNPCSNCVSLNTLCELIPGRKGSTYKKRKREADPDVNTGGHGSDTHSHLASSRQKAGNSMLFPLNGDGNRTVAPSNGSQETVLGAQNSTTRTLNGLPHAVQVSETAPTAVDVGTTSTVWTSSLEKAKDVENVEQASPEKLGSRHSLGPGSASQVDGEAHSHERIVYGSEAQNFSILPHMTGHRRFQTERRQSSLRTSVLDQNQPFPVGSIPASNWIEKAVVNDNPSDSPFSHLTQENLFYLVRMKNVLVFPPQHVVDEYMISFINHVLPEFPVIDRNRLSRLYDAFTAGVVMSPLLFHSILYAASQYVDESILHQAGFENRTCGKEYFYGRATLLYSLDCEREQLVTIQAVLFISPWWSDYSEEKDTRYWISCACNLAQTMGEIDLAQSLLDSVCKWYPRHSLIHKVHIDEGKARDHNASVGLGRPFLLNSDDVDVEILTEADFYEEFGEDSSSNSPSGRPRPRVNFNSYSRVHVFFALELVRLSLIMDRSIKANSRKRIDPLNALKVFIECQEQLSHEPPVISISFQTRLSNPPKNTAVDDMWLTFLQINYERIVSLNSRLLHKALSETRAALPTAPSLAQVKTSIVRSAAKTINMYEDLLVVDLLRYSHGFMNTAIFTALVTYAEEIKLASEESHRYKAAANKFSMGLVILEEMSKYWSVPVWAHALFKLLSLRNFSRLKKLPQRPSRWHSPSAQDQGPDRDGEPHQAQTGWQQDSSEAQVVDEPLSLEHILQQDFNPWFPFDETEIKYFMNQSDFAS